MLLLLIELLRATSHADPTALSSYFWGLDLDYYHLCALRPRVRRLDIQVGR
jgi:hypothetical protein